MFRAIKERARVRWARLDHTDKLMGSVVLVVYVVTATTTLFFLPGAEGAPESVWDVLTLAFVASPGIVILGGGLLVLVLAWPS